MSHSGRHERTTVCTLLLYAGSIEGCSAVLAVRRYLAFGAWFVPSWCAQKKKSRFTKQKNLVVLCSSEAGWLAEVMIQLALTLPLQEEHLPSTHVHLAVGTPQCHDLDWEERLCRELATLTHTRTRFLLLFLILLHCGRLWCCYYCCLAFPLSSLVTRTKRKKEKRQREIMKNGFLWIQNCWVGLGLIIYFFGFGETK